MRNQHYITQFWCAYRTELRLLVWHWSYGLMHLFWLALLMQRFSRDVGSAQLVMEQDFVRFAAIFLGLGAVFLAGFSATRSQRTRFHDLDNTFSTGVNVHLGRVFACFTALMLFVVEPLLQSFIRGPIYAFMAGLLPFLVSVTVTIGFITFGTYWLMSLLGSVRWAYPVLVAIWMVFATLPNLLNEQLAEPPAFSSLVSFLRIGTGRGGYTEVFGSLTQGALPQLYNAFYLGLTLLLIGLIVVIYRRRRFRQFSRTGAALAALALMIVLWSGGSYVKAVEDGRSRAPLDDPASASPDALTRAFNTLLTTAEAVRRYDITLDASQPAQPVFMVRMDITNETASPLTFIHLTLYHSFTIDSASVPYERDGDHLRLLLPEPLPPGATLPVEMNYSGSVWRVELFSGVPEAVDFTTDAGIRLAYNTAWYPRAGIIDLDAPEAYAAPAVASSFNLSIINRPQDMTFSSNLEAISETEFTGESIRSVFLLGSPRLVREVQGAVELVIARNDYPVVAPLIETHFQPGFTHIQSFFPDLAVSRWKVLAQDDLPLPFNRELLLSPEGRMYATSYYPPSTKQIVTSYYAADTQDLPDAALPMLFYPVVASYWTLAGQEMSFLVDGASLFLWHHYQAAGDANQITAALQMYRENVSFNSGLYIMFGDENSTQPEITRVAGVDVALALNDVYQRGGQVAVIDALAQMMAQADTLQAFSTEQMNAWLEDIVNVE